jgi:hypothetical protein
MSTDMTLINPQFLTNLRAALDQRAARRPESGGGRRCDGREADRKQDAAALGHPHWQAVSMEMPPLGDYEQLLKSRARPWSAGTIVHGSNVLDDLVVGLARHSSTDWTTEYWRRTDPRDPHLNLGDHIGPTAGSNFPAEHGSWQRTSPRPNVPDRVIGGPVEPYPGDVRESVLFRIDRPSGGRG